MEICSSGTPAAAGYGDLQQPLHMLLVPVQSEGHINGLLRLAQALVALEQGVLITFAYPARFHRLALKRNKLSALLNTTTLSAQTSSALRVEVAEDGLPLDEAQVITLGDVMETSHVFQNSVKLLLDDLLHRSKLSSTALLPPLSYIVSDTFCPWAQDLADAVRLPCVDFWTSTAATYSMGSHLSLLLSNGTIPLPKNCWLEPGRWTVDAPLIEGIPGLSPFPPTDLLFEIVQAEDITDPKLQFMVAAFSHIRKAQAILVNSVYELESQVFDALEAKGFPIHAVGPLPDTATSGPLQESHMKHECIQWLDKQPPSSVIYVALGSVAMFSTVEMHAIALGLKAAGQRFLWVIRQDSISSTLSEALPDGFLQCTVNKGVGLIISWSPQTEVLAHPSIGAFFSHCGWNSTLESMWEGVPMIACPRVAEQRSNSRWIVETWKMGVGLERQLDGSFTKEAVERALKEVLASKGELDGHTYYKERALHVKKVARSAIRRGGTSHSSLVDFLQRLRRNPNCD